MFDQLEEIKFPETKKQLDGFKVRLAGSITSPSGHPIRSASLSADQSSMLVSDSKTLLVGDLERGGELLPLHNFNTAGDEESILKARFHN